MSRPLRIGISGFGGTGAHQAHTFNARSDCRVVAVFDPKPGGRERAGKALPGVRVTGDLDELLRSEIDVLAVCSPFHHHAEQIERGLAAGKHILCEQPLSGTLDGCRRIIAAARAHPERVVGVQRFFRCIPLHVGMKRIILAGELGRVSFVEGNSIQNATRRLGLHDTWAMETAPSPLLLAGCHVVDLLCWLLEDQIEQISVAGNNTAFPEYENSDLCIALLKFRSGALGKITTAFAAGRPPDHSVRIVAAQRSIENNLLLEPDGRFRLIEKPRLRHRQSARLSLKQRLGALWRDTRDNTKSILAHRLFAMGAWMYGRRSGYPVSAYPLRLHEHGLGLRASVGAFVDDVRNGRASLDEVIEAARTVAACLAGVEACRRGTPVNVSDFWSSDMSNDAEPNDSDSRATARNDGRALDGLAGVR